MARPSTPTKAARKSRPKRRQGYHHGDLRQALVDSARALLESGGPAALTLRAAAREAGVSQTAPYRHFASRDDMIAAVAEDGFRRLHARMVAAAAPQSGKRALQQIAVEYMRFALESPAEYRIMFGREGAELEQTTTGRALGEASSAVMDLLEGGIAQMQRAGAIRTGDSSVMAFAAWSLVHGVVMLTLDGQGTRTRHRSPEELVKEATTLLMIGMKAPGAP